MDEQAHTPGCDAARYDYARSCVDDEITLQGVDPVAEGWGDLDALARQWLSDGTVTPDCSCDSGPDWWPSYLPR